MPDITATAALMLEIEETEAARLRERLRRGEVTKDPFVILIMEMDLAAQLGKVNYLKSFIGGDGNQKTQG